MKRIFLLIINILLAANVHAQVGGAVRLEKLHDKNYALYVLVKNQTRTTIFAYIDFSKLKLVCDGRQVAMNWSASNSDLSQSPNSLGRLAANGWLARRYIKALAIDRADCVASLPVLTTVVAKEQPGLPAVFEKGSNRTTYLDSTSEDLRDINDIFSASKKRYGLELAVYGEHDLGQSDIGRVNDYLVWVASRHSVPLRQNPTLSCERPNDKPIALSYDLGKPMRSEGTRDDSTHMDLFRVKDLVGPSKCVMHFGEKRSKNNKFESVDIPVEFSGIFIPKIFFDE